MRSARETGLAGAHGSVVLYAAIGVFSAYFRHGTRVHALGVDARSTRGAIVVVRALYTQACHLKIKKSKSYSVNLFPLLHLLSEPSGISHPLVLTIEFHLSSATSPPLHQY